MDETRNWDKIIVYHEIPFFGPDAFYQFKYKKIYIHNLIKNYPLFYEYILRHEKAHYMNNNSNNNFFKKIWTDIKIDWKGSWEISRNKKLYKDIKSYKKMKSQLETDIKDKIHYHITNNLRPDSKIVITAFALIGLIIGTFITKIIFGIDLIKIYLPKIKSIICT